MSKLSYITNLKPEEKEEKKVAQVLTFDYAQATIQNRELVAELRETIRKISPIIGQIKMDMSAIDVLKNNCGTSGIIDILSHGDLNGFHKRLGISQSDLFGRSDAGKRDIYVSSLTEDVTNFIANLWNAVRNAIQKVYDWSTNLSGAGSKIGMAKSQLDATVSALSAKGNAKIICDMIDPNDWAAKVTEVLKLYTVLEEIMATATQTIVAGQLTENMLQDQLLGKMQRANVNNIRLVIEDGSKSSSFKFPGIGSGRIDLENSLDTTQQCKSLFDSVIAKIGTLNQAVANYAQNITTAQTQYKCNTDCAAVVSNISSATQMITKSIVSVNNYVLETISGGILDICSKVTSAIQALPDAQPAPQEPAQQIEPAQAQQPETPPVQQ